MNTLIVIALITSFGLLMAALIVLFFKEGLIEVDPKREVVYKNLWTGEPYALKPGMRLIIPGIHKKIAEITMENEPSDPLKVDVITGDGINIGFDYIIYTQRVENSVKAATEINYAKRRELIIDRIKAYFQNEATKYSAEDFILKESLKTSKNKNLLDEVEKSVNKYLADSSDNIKDAWGIEVVIQIQNVKLPEKLEEVVEEAVTAEKEGERIRIKAEKAGVPPWLMAVGDIAYDIFRTGKKKEV